MFYLVIDLEMCKVPRDFRCKAYTYRQETIQIGAVLLDESYRQIDTFRQFVKPEYGVVDPYIEKLTGISNSDLNDAPCFEDALLRMLEWIGEREYKIYSWSNSDRNQIVNELNSKEISGTLIDSFTDETRWIDYQDIFVERYNFSRRISLTEALNLAMIVPEGRCHDGLDDAINTGLLIAKLELDPDLELTSYIPEEKPTEHLSFTLGELFANIDTQPA